MSKPAPQDLKDLAVDALTRVFVQRDPTVVNECFAEDYVQHNPRFDSGRAAVADIIPMLPAGVTYEPGLSLADGDLVAVHGRYIGLGPQPLVAVDLFRVADGRLAEHWDVLQPEVSASETRSGNPMFEPLPRG